MKHKGKVSGDETEYGNGLKFYIRLGVSSMQNGGHSSKDHMPLSCLLQKSVLLTGKSRMGKS